MFGQREGTSLCILGDAQVEMSSWAAISRQLMAPASSRRFLIVSMRMTTAEMARFRGRAGFFFTPFLCPDFAD